MQDTFDITYTFEKLHTEGTPFVFVDASTTFQTLQRFLAVYKGQFIIHLGKFHAPFNLDPDLSTVFRELPDVLEQLTIGTELPVEIDFFEQGTDVGMLMERRDDQICICFETSRSTGVPYRNLPKNSICVSSSNFINEWTTFLLDVLDMLRRVNPNIIEDSSYLIYRERIISIQNSSKKQR